MGPRNAYLVTVLLPSNGGVGLDAEVRSAASEDLKLVLLGLGIEHLPARQRNDTGLDALLGQDLGGSNGNLDFGTSGDDVQVLALNVVKDVAALDGMFDGGVLEVGEGLTGEGENGGVLLGLKGEEVSGAGLVAVSRTPEVKVRDGTEVDGGFDRLVSRAVLAKTNGVVCSDPDDVVLRQSTETDGTGGVRDEVLQNRYVSFRMKAVATVFRTKKVPPKGIIPP